MKYCKSDCIFWVLVDEKIVLRNFRNNVAIELDAQRTRIWSLLDGAHTQEEISAKLVAERSFRLSSEDISELVSTLHDSGFLREA